MVALALTAPTGNTASSVLPTTSELLKRLSQENFAGVSGPVVVRLNNVLITSTVAVPIILGVQADGSLQIVG